MWWINGQRNKLRAAKFGSAYGNFILAIYMTRN